MATGEDRVDITYLPQAPISSFGSNTNLRVWKIYGDGNVFYDNTDLDTVALQQDMGVTTSVFPGEQGAELSDEDLERLVSYVRLLGLPGRRGADDPLVAKGEELFVSTGCVACHVHEAFTGSTHPMVELRDQDIRPFSDLLVHDMGEGLADPQGGPLAREWRTAPLWGLGSTADVTGQVALLHDGRARSPLEAILWHGGEATFAHEAVRTMAAEDREALLAFLGSL